MRISFDLDDTLICRQPAVPREPPLPWYWKLLSNSEPLRRGAIALMHQLQQEGWEIWIYTTSYRNPASVRRWLQYYGVRVVRVINQDVHNATFGKTASSGAPSKNPAAFEIDLHVDDSHGVRMEGERHGFNVAVVSPDDESWAELVLTAAAEVQKATIRERRGTLQ